MLITDRVERDAENSKLLIGASFQTDLREFERALENDRLFDIATERGKDSGRDLFSTVSKEVVDFFCDRTGKYTDLKKKVDNNSEKAVDGIVGALLSSGLFAEAALTAAVSAVFRVAAKKGVDKICRLVK